MRLKRFFQSQLFPANIALVSVFFIFALMSLQFALMPFVALEKQTLAYQQQSQAYLASIGVKPSSQYLAKQEVTRDEVQIMKDRKQTLLTLNNETMKSQRDPLGQSSNVPNVLGVNTSKFSISFIDALKASIGDLFFWWPWGRTSKQAEVFEVNPAEIIIDFSYESLPQDYNPKVGEEFALDVILHQNSGDINNIESLNLGLTYSPSDLIFIGGLSNNSQYRNKYTSQTNIIESFFGHDFFEYANPDKKILLHLRFKRISANETRIQLVKNDLLLNDSSSPVNITTFEKVLVEVENTEKPPPWCTKEYPEKPTGLIAVSGTQAGSVMLNWTKSSFPVTHYAIVYGIESGNFSYGNPNVGDVDQYLVEGLKPGNLYYFAVIAVNDCANSDYSDETSAEAASENGLIPNTCQCDLSSVVEDECISPKTAYCSGKFTCICSVPPTNTCNLHSTQGACIAVIDDLGRPTCMWHESFGGTYPACKLAGDYDNNETVNLDDIMYILDHYNGTESEFTQPMDAILIVLDNYDF